MTIPYYFGFQFVTKIQVCQLLVINDVLAEDSPNDNTSDLKKSTTKNHQRLEKWSLWTTQNWHQFQSLITFNHSKLGSFLINSAFLNFLQSSWLIKVWCSWEPCYDEEKSKVQRKETADANLHLTESPKDWISWTYYDFLDQQIKLKHLGPTTPKKAVVHICVFPLFRFLIFHAISSVNKTNQS